MQPDNEFKAEHDRLGAVILRAWADPVFKERLITAPKDVLREAGVEIPTGTDIRVVENTSKVTYVTLPFPPTGEELSQDAADVLAGSWRASATGYGTCPTWHPPPRC